jgi:integrase
MVWRKANGKTFNCYVSPLDSARVVCSTETTVKTVADAVEAFARGLELRAHGRDDVRAVLSAIGRRELTLAEAYRLGEDGAARLLAQRAADAADTDLTGALADFLAMRGDEVRQRYGRQIRALFPEQPLRRSLLTAPNVARRLDALECSNATRNRYRAALSAFCTWLVRRGTLELNPARAVTGYAEALADPVFITMDEAERLVAALPPQYRGREALMAGTGADWSDTMRLAVGDIDLTTLTVRLHGSKTRWRNRVVRITQPWTVPYIRAAMRGKLPTAPAFSGSESKSIKAHHAAAAAAKITTATTLHQWRNTYAVAELRAGEKATVVAYQLGHRDASLVWKRYGRFVPEAIDYRSERAALTTEVTTTPKLRSVNQ